MPKRRTITACLIVLMMSVSFLQGEQLERTVKAIAGQYTLQKPVQLALSPSGSKFAVADQFANRVFVFSTTGDLLWIVGDVTKLNLPIAVCFESEDALLFSQQGQPFVYRVAEKDVNRIDTIGTLADQKSPVKEIDRIVKSPGGSYLVLDRFHSRVSQFDAAWKFVRVVAKQGQGKGKLWNPSSFAVDLGGNVLVADHENFPLQAFTPAGDLLYCGGWNGISRDHPWDASAVAVSRQEITWTADDTNQQWRLFDRTGSEIDKRPFDLAYRHPIDAALTSDNRLIILDQRGAILIYSVD